MKCPHCTAHDSKVTKTTRPIKEAGFPFGQLKRRERECKVCGRSFPTFEIQEDVFRRLLLHEEGSLRRRETKILIPKKPRFRKSHV